MNITEIKKYLQEIESHLYTFKELITYDCLFEVKGLRPDDNNLNTIIVDICQKTHINKYAKLRGDWNKNPKLVDFTNDTKYCHGYIIFTNKSQTSKLEKYLVHAALTHSINVKKINVSLLSADIENRKILIFNSLFDLA